MYNSLSSSVASQASNQAYASDAQTINASRLVAITERVRVCCGLATNVNMGLGVELDRLFGSLPQTADTGNPSAPANVGALGELDDLVSILTNALERINGQTNRFSQV